MRRPSWNKSQAIQQVISLKALLEPTDDDLPAPVGVSSAFTTIITTTLNLLGGI
jgi:hypothetical protein